MSLAPGELLTRYTSLYRKRPDRRYDVLLDVARLLQSGEEALEVGTLRLIRPDPSTYLVEESRGALVVVVFAATYRDGDLMFTHYEDGRWQDVLRKHYDLQFPSLKVPST